MKAEPPSTHRFFFGECLSGIRVSSILFEERLSGTRVSSIPFGERLAGTRYSSIPFGERLPGIRYSAILFGERLAGIRYSSIPFGKRLSGTRYSSIPFGERLSVIRYSSTLFGESLSGPPDSQFHISMIPHQHHSSFNRLLPGERSKRTPDGSCCPAGTRSPSRRTGGNRSPCCSGRPTNSGHRCPC